MGHFSFNNKSDSLYIVPQCIVLPSIYLTGTLQTTWYLRDSSSDGLVSSFDTPMSEVSSIYLICNAYVSAICHISCGV
jgi:hypothetical protein